MFEIPIRLIHVTKFIDSVHELHKYYHPSV